MQRVMDYVGAEPVDTLLLQIYPLFSSTLETFTLYSDTLAAYSSQQEILDAGDGYFYDAGRKVLLIKFEHVITVTSGIRVVGIELPAGISTTEPETGKAHRGSTSAGNPPRRTARPGR